MSNNPNKKWEKPWDEDTWRDVHGRLHRLLTPELERIGIYDLHASDFQNVLCEVDKYLREKLGEGHPKQRFVRPSPEPLPGAADAVPVAAE
jgi:hypothetical protein